MRHETTLLFNAGGDSRRMGRSKALLPVPPDETPLLVTLIDRLATLVETSYVITNEPAVVQVLSRYDVLILPDDRPGLGPLGGLTTALRRGSEWVLHIACDLPLLKRSVVAYLLQLVAEGRGDGFDAAVPYIDERYQPHLALYHPRCLPAIESAIQDNRLAMQSFYADVTIYPISQAELRTYDPKLLSFLNVNRPEEWQRVHEMIVQDQSG